jgi:2-methylcitrate dehydratase PrpD
VTVPALTTATRRFARHVVSTRFEDLGQDAIDRAKVFILDTLGVGIAGSSASGSDALAGAARAWGAGEDAVVWGRGTRAPAPTAALLNGYASHCQEYDCVHEAAVLHPMATLLPAALAYADREGGVSGRELLVAVAVGIDVAAGLGLASRAGLRFFRPASSGGFGAAAAVARLASLDEDDVVSAFGLQYAQTSGTMQPHVEGSMALPMQVGFNGRGAVGAVDLVRAGASGPREVFDGPFGYLPLYEGAFDLAPVLAELGRTWRIAEVSHKPFPAGRATHGGIEGLACLRLEHGFGVDDVVRVTVIGPPLINRLAARPDLPDPTPNYARLCMSFVLAKVLLHGELDLSHYRDDGLTDPETHHLAGRIEMRVEDSPDPNALVPQRVEVELADGRVLHWACETMLAGIGRRLTREQHLAKFRRCLDFAAMPLPSRAGDDLITLVDELETLPDSRALGRAMTATPN